MVVTIALDVDGYEVCFVEEPGFLELCKPLYDVVDFDARASRGGDQLPLQGTLSRCDALHSTADNRRPGASHLKVTPLWLLLLLLLLL